VSAEYSQLKKSRCERPTLSVFSIVRNELFFLPHFLRHYRNLGVRDFLFLDDRSTDGTLEFLLSQDDCTVMQANLAFGDPYEGKRFGVASKTLLPRQLLQGRWVLSVDADEFLLLPSGFATIDALTSALQNNGLKAARALMFDFFPPSLRSLDDAPAQSNPFDLCQYFDAWETVDWPNHAIQPVRLSNGDGVRPRMFARLRATSEAIRDFPSSYKVASMYKVPLVFWTADTAMLTSHHSNEPASDKIQLALAHFKFVPGYKARIAGALATKAYWQDSIEYRFLDIASRELIDWPLEGPRTRRFDSPMTLEDLGLLFSRLPAAPATP
jgi:hypothetical protein